VTLIKRTAHDGVRMLSLANGVTNSITPALVSELNEVLSELENDSSCTGVVLTSESEKFFSIGFDLPSLFHQSPEGFLDFYRSFNRAALCLFTLPVPTLCAIPGHATAGGCILATMCDYRYIAEGRKFIGLNEIKLGVAVPYLADSALRLICGDRIATEMFYNGEFLDPAKAKEVGLVDAVLPSEELIPKALEKVASIGSYYSKAFRAIKANRIGVVRDLYANNRTHDEDTFLDLWFDEKARKGLAEAIKKF